jgi:hypothetical protein
VLIVVATGLLVLLRYHTRAGLTANWVEGFTLSSGAHFDKVVAVTPAGCYVERAAGCDSNGYLRKSNGEQAGADVYNAVMAALQNKYSINLLTVLGSRRGEYLSLGHSCTHPCSPPVYALLVHTVRCYQFDLHPLLMPMLLVAACAPPTGAALVHVDEVCAYCH